MTVSGSDVHLDFTGTDPQILAAYNIPTASKPHAWLTQGLVHHLLSTDPTIPANGAVRRAMRVTTPLGSLVNPVMPAAVGSRVTAATKVLDMTMGALAQAIPNEGQVFSFHGFRFEVVEREHNRLTRLRVRKLA